jgi:hypothetical protein
MSPEESPELKTLQKVTERLERAGIPYMLTGSMALNFYGHPRATNDFDIVIEIQGGDVDRLVNLFQGDFYISRDAVRQAVAQKGPFNIIDNETVFKVDLIVRKTGPYPTEQFKRKTLKELAGFKTYVISPEDLILAKLDWSRESLSEMQERDVRNLLNLLKKELDYDYMEKWSTVLGIMERLKNLYVSP